MGENHRRRGRARPAMLVASALLVLAPPALAAGRCASERDQAVFEVEALKTELMVVATTCREEERYNTFIRTYRPALAENGRAFGQYFVRNGGRAGVRAQDIYITELANARSTEAQALGTDFCPRNTGLFEEVMALSGPQDLPAYAAAKRLFNTSIGPCDLRSASAAPAAGRGHSAPRRGRR